MPRRDDESRDEGFLGRWARRKHEAQQPGRLPSSTDVAPGADGPAGAIPPCQPTSTSGEGSQAEPRPEMVEPPSLDLVDKDFDLAHWLKQNVPEDWKLKALRRAWESDPAIAGYEDPARDYALDWNTPGGAPGYGPLSESDNVEEMLANIFGKPAETPPAEAAQAGEAVRNDAADIRPSSNEREASDSAASQNSREAAREMSGSPRSDDPGETRKTRESPTKIEASASGEIAALQNRAENPPSPQRPRRRGGSATPL